MRGKVSGAYLFLLMTIFPLLVHDGYTDILYVKTGYFYLLTGGYFLLMLGSLLFKPEKAGGKNWGRKAHGTEWCVFGYGIIAVLAWLLCENKQEQFSGIYGRNMGLLTILLCVLCYICIYHFLEFKQYILTGMLGAAALVCIVAVCNHLGFDPLSMYPGGHLQSEFLSTMGNINTLSAYIGILLPFGMTLFMVSKEMLSKKVYGIFCFLGFIGMISANSDSAYLTVGIAFVVLLYLAKDTCQGTALLALVLEYGTAVLFMHGLREMRGIENCMKFRSGLSEMLVDIRLNLGIIILAGVLLMRLMRWQGKEEAAKAEKFWQRMRKILLIILAVIVCIFIGVLLFVNLAWEKKEAKEYLGELYRYLYFSDAWGTKRLRIWKAAVKTYVRLPLLHKLIGVGPAGFYFATQKYLTAEELAVFAKQGNLVDAHNVYLQELVLFGVIGLLCFLGIFGSALYSFWRKGKTESYMLAFAMFIIAFFVQAFVNNSHIYIDTLVFMLMAVGRNLGKCDKNG
ncbi:MAG: O-antigen ligase family protein [Lachnospiraceae bacterium]|nr:O-antigen ligase family protein [Lachnospiraceae bacterium]